ncbi:tumor necrosis factor receptor superfamily member 6B-like [Nematolebias whitei]|uniref:tumor necrosis factor receptor superfamily member 6B-like n=1 Tax=Nematolebias whitei TaxID=451745 RepID=UPI0018972756|nr:tumor necrosis factor receptor superfamily member 6B-like [Nematolebias whitei]
MFVSVLLLLLSVRLWLITASPPTFQHQDPISGRSLQCDRCPPGNFLRARCSSAQSSQCAPCPEGSFTELWNYIPTCLRCGVCGRNQVVKKKCTADSNCQCECKQGYYYNHEHHMCFQHSACPSGQGVLTPGTADKNTVCHICSNNTFSNVSSAHDGCRQHKSCSDAGLKLVLKGSAWHDSVCAKCGEVKDGAECLKEIIPAFFRHHKIKMKSLHRIIHKLSSKRKIQGRTSKLSFSEHLSLISSWVSSATLTQIQKLPDVLIKVKGKRVGEQLQRKLDQINTCLIKSCLVMVVRCRAESKLGSRDEGPGRTDKAGEWLEGKAQGMRNRTKGEPELDRTQEGWITAGTKTRPSCFSKCHLKRFYREKLSRLSHKLSHIIGMYFSKI